MRARTHAHTPAPTIRRRMYGMGACVYRWLDTSHPHVRASVGSMKRECVCGCIWIMVIVMSVCVCLCVSVPDTQWHIYTHTHSHIDRLVFIYTSAHAGDEWVCDNWIFVNVINVSICQCFRHNAEGRLNYTYFEFIIYTELSLMYRTVYVSDICISNWEH